MTDIVLLTRDPAVHSGNNWVFAAQDENPKTGTPWRAIIWGKGRGSIKGTSFAEVDTSFDEYVANRKATGYVEQVRIKIYFPMAKIFAFIEKNTDKINAVIEAFSIMLQD